MLVEILKNTNVNLAIINMSNNVYIITATAQFLQLFQLEQP